MAKRYVRNAFLYRWESWVIGWATLADGLAIVLTLGYWFPNWDFKAIFWAAGRRIRRTKIG